MTEINSHFTIRKLLRFTFPSIIMMIFTSIYGVFDGLFISNIVGDTAFAGVNFIMPYIMLLGTFGFMFGTGGSALIAKTYGEGDRERGNRYFTMIIEVLLIIGIICTVVGYFTIKPVAKLLGASEAMLPYCEKYGNILVLFTAFFMFQYAFQSFMVVAGKPMLGFIFCVAAGLTNIIGDYILIAIVKIGVQGAAIATGISQVIGALLPVGYLIFFKGKTPLAFTKPCFEFKPVLKAATNGLSEMVSNVSLSIISILFNSQLMKYMGQSGVTAYGIIMYVGFIFTGVYFGYATGVAPIISFHYGAKNEKELQSLLKNCLLAYIVASIVLSTLSIAIASPLSKAFIRNDDSLQIICANAIRIYSISYYLAGFNIFASSFFTDLNDGFVSGLLSLLRTFVFQIIAIYLMPLLFNETGLWLSVTVSEALALIVCIIFFIIKNKKYHYWPIKEKVKESISNE